MVIKCPGIFNADCIYPFFNNLCSLKKNDRIFGIPPKPVCFNEDKTFLLNKLQFKVAGRPWMRPAEDRVFTLWRVFGEVYI